MSRYDIAIIGTGPAGISAAITAKVRNKNVLLLGSRDLSSKMTKAHKIKNYTGLPDISGRDMADAFMKHIDSMGIEITEEKITAVYSMGDYFALQTGENEFLEAESLILATGVMQGKMYPGEEELLGRGVSYCATCDAALYHDRTAVIVGATPKEEAEEIASEVIYMPLYKEDVNCSDQVKIVREKPEKITEEDGMRVLKTDQNSYAVDGVFILRESVSPGQLVPGLEVKRNHVLVDRHMATNIPGCFACGDIVGKPYQYIKAAGEGNIAALSAVDYLAKRKREKEKAEREAAEIAQQDEQ